MPDAPAPSQLCLHGPVSTALRLCLHAALPPRPCPRGPTAPPPRDSASAALSPWPCGPAPTRLFSGSASTRLCLHGPASTALGALFETFKSPLAGHKPPRRLAAPLAGKTPPLGWPSVSGSPLGGPKPPLAAINLGPSLDPLRTVLGAPLVPSAGSAGRGVFVLTPWNPPARAALAICWMGVYPQTDCGRRPTKPLTGPAVFWHWSAAHGMSPGGR